MSYLYSLEGVSKEFLDLIQVHSEGRITRATLAFYRSYKPAEDEDGEVFVFVARAFGDSFPLVAASSFYITLHDKECHHSITVTHKQHRNKGLGSDLLGMKVGMVGNRSLKRNYQAIVAEDDAPSLRICEKNNLPKVAEEIRKRREDEEYKAIVFRKE